MIYRPISSQIWLKIIKSFDLIQFQVFPQIQTDFEDRDFHPSVETGRLVSRCRYVFIVAQRSRLIYSQEYSAVKKIDKDKDIRRCQYVLIICESIRLIIQSWAVKANSAAIARKAISSEKSKRVDQSPAPQQPLLAIFCICEFCILSEA